MSGNDCVTKESKIPGVYFVNDRGDAVLVHEYADGEYMLEDIVELFAVGRREDGGALVVKRSELRPLKIRADAESFDHEEGFIEMCLDIWRFGSETEAESLRFVSLD